MSRPHSEKRDHRAPMYGCFKSVSDATSEAHLLTFLPKPAFPADFSSRQVATPFSQLIDLEVSD